MNTPNFQNILATYEIIQVQKEFFFKNTTDIHAPRSVNGDDSSDNAP